MRGPTRPGDDEDLDQAQGLFLSGAFRRRAGLTKSLVVVLLIMLSIGPLSIAYRLIRQFLAG